MAALLLRSRAASEVEGSVPLHAASCGAGLPGRERAALLVSSMSLWEGGTGNGVACVALPWVPGPLEMSLSLGSSAPDAPAILSGCARQPSLAWHLPLLWHSVGKRRWDNTGFGAVSPFRLQ